MNNTKKKIEELKVKIAELEAELNKPKTMFERAENGGNYSFVGANFDVKSIGETKHPVDDFKFKSTNYYLDAQLAKKVAKYYRGNNWFIRKSIEFSDGYEWVDGGENYNIVIDVTCMVYLLCVVRNMKSNSGIYMTYENGKKFKAWLEEFAPLKKGD